MKQPDTSSCAARLLRGLAVAALLLGLGMPAARAAVRVGAKGGFQLASLSFNDDLMNRSNRMGFFIGPTLKFSLPVTGLGIDATALYDRRDLKVEEETFQQQSLVLQGSARYSVGIGEVLAFFVHAGPQFSFNVGDDVIHWISDNGTSKQFSLQETMLSFNLGFGLTFAKHFEGALLYNIPVSKTADFTWHELTDQLYEQTLHHAKSRTSTWSIAVTYYF